MNGWMSEVGTRPQGPAGRSSRGSPFVGGGAGRAALLFDMQCRQEQKTMIDSTCLWVDNTAAIAVATRSICTHETRL